MQQAPRLALRSFKTLQAAAASQASKSGDILLGLEVPGWLAAETTSPFRSLLRRSCHTSTAPLGFNSAAQQQQQLYHQQLYQQQHHQGGDAGGSWLHSQGDTSMMAQALVASNSNNDGCSPQGTHGAASPSSLDSPSSGSPPAKASNCLTVAASSSGALYEPVSTTSTKTTTAECMASLPAPAPVVGPPPAPMPTLHELQVLAALQQQLSGAQAALQVPTAPPAALPDAAMAFSSFMAPPPQLPQLATRPVTLADFASVLQHFLPAAPPPPPPTMVQQQQQAALQMNAAALLLSNQQQQLALLGRLPPGLVTPMQAVAVQQQAATTAHLINVLQQQQQQQQLAPPHLPRAMGPSPLHNHHAPLPLPGARGTSRSIALNKDITATTSIEQLLAIVRVHWHEFDFFNISTAVSRVPKLAGAEGLVAHNHHAHHHHAHHHHAHNHAAAAVHNHVGLAPAACGLGCALGGVAPVCPGATAALQGASSCSHLSVPVRELADRLCELVLRHMHEFDGRGLANTAWAFAKLRYVPDASLPPALCRAAVRRVDEFAAQNTANLAWALVYMHYQDAELIQLLKRKALQQVCEMKPQELANMMWALASHEQLDEHTARLLGRRAAALAGHFKEQELSNVVWALGRAQYLDLSLLEPLLAVVRARLPAFMPQGISNMLWALGQLHYHDEPLMAALSRECVRNLHAYDAQALSNLAAGLAALGGPNSMQLMAAVAHEAASRGSRMAPQHLASVLAASAQHGTLNDRLVMSAVEMLHTRGSAVEPASLISLTSAAAALDAARAPAGTAPAALLEPLAAAVVGTTDKLQGQALASVVSNCALMGGAFAGATLPALAARLPASVQFLTPKQATAVTLALQQVGALSLELVPCLLNHAMAAATRSDQQEGALCATQLSVTLLAATSLGYAPRDAAAAEALRVATRLALVRMDPPQLCSSCWALAAMGALDSPLLGVFHAALEAHAALGTLGGTGAVGQLLSPDMMKQMLDAHVMVAAKRGGGSAAHAGQGGTVPGGSAAALAVPPASLQQLMQELSQHQQQLALDDSHNSSNNSNNNASSQGLSRCSNSPPLDAVLAPQLPAGSSYSGFRPGSFDGGSAVQAPAPARRLPAPPLRSASDKQLLPGALPAGVQWLMAAAADAVRQQHAPPPRSASVNGNTTTAAFALGKQLQQQLDTTAADACVLPPTPMSRAAGSGCCNGAPGTSTTPAGILTGGHNSSSGGLPSPSAAAAGLVGVQRSSLFLSDASSQEEGALSTTLAAHGAVASSGNNNKVADHPVVGAEAAALQEQQAATVATAMAAMMIGGDVRAPVPAPPLGLMTIMERADSVASPGMGSLEEVGSGWWLPQDLMPSNAHHQRVAAASAAAAAAAAAFPAPSRVA